MDNQHTKTPVSDMESFFEIRDGNEVLLSISQLSENQSSKNGLSYEYKDGQLESIKEYSNGVESVIVATFKGNEMTQYEHGNKEELLEKYPEAVELILQRLVKSC